MEFEEKNVFSIKKCLIEEYDKALKELKLQVGLSKTLILLGRSQEFHRQDLIDFPKDRKIQIMIYDGLVYMKWDPSEVHEFAKDLFGIETLNALNANASSKQLFISIGSTGVSVLNYNHCGDKFTKCPDSSIALKRRFRGYKSKAIFVVEVGYRNENFEMLLRQAEVYLNKYTNVEYCFFVYISIEDEKKVL